MSQHRATHDLSAPIPPGAQRQPVGPAVLFIVAVLIAGLTCVLYLWQQSQIVAGKQDLQQLNHTLSVLVQQRSDLEVRAQNLQSVTKVVSAAQQYHMIQGNSHDLVPLTVPSIIRPSTLAQVPPSQQHGIILPATNAAITTWWQNAWDGLYGLMQ